ncbi:MAG: class I SAM-dependent methyltransferase [Candidatus Bathyarchaeota archaeon]|nr:MAG: class I SAM-dependent methyltransferase [Candidatus Bathyarchaeota archaeon]
MEELAEANENTRKSYDLVAEKYHELFKNEMKQKEFDRLLLDEFAKHFDSESTICDMGCGPSGHIAKHLYDKGLNVFGIDISEKCIEIAQRENSEMKFQTMDMTSLQIADEAIDGIISFYSIIHTPKQFVKVFFREFNRVLRKGGRILVVVKKGDTEGYVDRLLGYKTRIYSTYFNEEEIKGFLETNGFRIILSETRQPYEFEIPNERIYTIGEKL